MPKRKVPSKAAKKVTKKPTTTYSTPPSDHPRPSAYAFRGSDDGSYAGVLGTKTPTGSRPVPTIARDHPPEPTVPGGLRAGPYDQNPQPGRVTQHPTPNRDRLTKAPKSEGGGSY